MVALVALVALLLGAAPLRAQLRPPIEGGRAGTLGQPAQWKGTAAGGATWDGTAGGTAALGIQRDLLNPMLSLLALHAEVFAESQGEALRPGVRARLISPFARVGAGLDYRSAEGGPDLHFSAFHPVRRGGLFGDGSVVRLDYVPARDHLMLGVEKPIRRNSRMGDSRPARDRVPLPAPALRSAAPIRSAQAAAALAEAGAAAARIRIATLPVGPLTPRNPLAATSELHVLQQDWARRPESGSAASDVRLYHQALDRAFSAAAGDTATDPTTLGRTLAAGAREVLLARVLLPYNSLLGQAKRRDSVRGLGVEAHGAFLRWLHVNADLDDARRADVLNVFDALIAIVEENRAAARAQWRDSRFVWLPLQYALLPEQHDSQEELDALVEQATGAAFTDGNFTSWVVNEQFQYQLSRTIREAQDYHVLWTHDFRGYDAGGEPDEMSYRHVLNSYLAALTERVREYDRTGRFPTYIIILDQWFYEVNHGRLWLTLLEDPLGHTLRLPRAHAAWQDTLAAAQRRLREAVAASSLLTAQTRLYGEGWLRDLVRVQVNITNPADPSFWSTRVVPPLPLPDNMMRDHRKIVFYDVTEADPYRGEALFTGAGVGEHYASLSWEDRALLVRGPAALPLKQAARDLLIAQGIPDHGIPHALRPVPRAPDYEERVRTAARRNQQPLRALQVHNEAGFGTKNVNVAKAVLYTLMPAGSVLKIPDSLWNSDFWGSMLTGCALRGVRVLLIAPAAANAPADAFGSVGRSRDLLEQLLAVRAHLDPHIDAAGGMLRIGLYSSELPVIDIPAKVRGVETAFASQPWLRSLFSFPQSVLEGLTDLADLLDGLSMAPAAISEFEHEARPKLHLKANFFASPEAWSLLSRAEWSEASWAYMQLRINQVQSRSSAVMSFEEYPESLPDVGSGMVQDWYDGLDAATRERVVFYSLMGSHNQNSRSMVIDAEIGFLIAHWPGIVPWIDLITLIGQTTWLDSPAGLDGLLPRDPSWKRRLAHWVRLAL